uniref:Uncharacterized protein n=1 Tax=Parascaris univalens TaxID=6257 RepID=A0A915C0W2_PARUN
MATIACPKSFFVVVSMWPANWRSPEVQKHHPFSTIHSHACSSASVLLKSYFRL